MKIIKPGTKKEWLHRVTCTGSGNGGDGCGAELEINLSDIFLTYSNVRDETDIYVTFKCPCCEVLTDLGRKYEVKIPNGFVVPAQSDWKDE